MARLWRKGRLAVGALAAALALSACSVTVQGQPDPVVSGPLAGPLKSAAPVSGEPSALVPVFFVRSGRLQSVQRTVDSFGDRLAEALEYLAAGPGQDTALGVRSALPADVSHLAVTVSAGVATVEVSPDFEQLGARNEILAVGQVVFTAMAQPGVGGVLLTASGEPLEIPIGSGRLVSRAVTRVDYPTIAPL